MIDCPGLKKNSFYGVDSTGKPQERPCCKFSLNQELRLQDSYNECLSCLQLEEKGAKSLRHRLLELEKRKVIYLDIFLNNYCNLVCKMCSSQFSSSWNQFDRDLGNETISPYKANLKNLSAPLEKGKKFFIKFWGGEPLMPPFQTDFLKELIARVSPELVGLLYVTNQTYPLSNETRDILKDFEKVFFTLSIDGDPQLNSFIRGGITPEQTKSFIDSTLRLDNSVLRSNSVVSLYNVNRLRELKEYLDQLGVVDQKVDLLSHPKFLEVSMLPKEKRGECLARVEGLGDFYSVLSAGFAKDSSGNPSLEDFKNHLKFFEKKEERSLKDYNEELAAWL